jgi:hypothetical protein
MSTPSSTSWLVAPHGLAARVRLLLSTTLRLAAIEWSSRRLTPLELCRSVGIEFGGFDTPQQTSLPLSVQVAHRWWAVETVLRWWPWARERLCLRRSLLLGQQLRHLSPTLCLEVVSVTPFVAHAWLLAGNHRLDMGEAGPMVTDMRESSS